MSEEAWKAILTALGITGAGAALNWLGLLRGFAQDHRQHQQNTAKGDRDERAELDKRIDSRTATYLDRIEASVQAKDQELGEVRQRAQAAEAMNRLMQQKLETLWEFARDQRWDAEARLRQAGAPHEMPEPPKL